MPIFLWIPFLGPRVQSQVPCYMTSCLLSFFFGNSFSVSFYILWLQNFWSTLARYFFRLYVNFGFPDDSSWCYLDCPCLLRITQVTLWPSLYTLSGSTLFICPIVGDAYLGLLDGRVSARFPYSIMDHLAGSVSKACDFWCWVVSSSPMLGVEVT